MFLKYIYFSLLSMMITASLSANTDLDALFAMNIEELLQVEVDGATKTEQSILTVPASVTVFKHEEIKRLGVSTLNELMNYVSGFQSRRTSANPMFFATTTRGHTSGVASRDILVLVDGQRMNSENNGGTGTRYALLPLENVKKIEFIKGAGSSIYGSNAFSAVINITTLSKANELTTKVSSHSVLGSALVSFTQDNLNFSGFIKAVKDNGLDYSGLTDTLNTGQLSAKDPYNSIDLYLQAHANDLSIYLSHSTKKNEDFYSLGIYSDENNREVQQTSLRLSYDVDVSTNLHSQIALSYMDTTDTIHAQRQPLSFADAYWHEQTPSIDVFNTYTISQSHNIQFGLEYRRPKQITSEVTSTNIATRPLGKEDERDIYGVYGQYQGSIRDDVHLTLGARYDEYSDFGGSFNPRVALVYDGLHESAFKFLYSRAFRAPSREELDLINNGALLGNPDLEPETIDSYEMIFIKQFQKHSLSLSYYVNMIDNIIIDVQQTNSRTIIRENAKGAIFRGFEVEYIGSPLKHLQIRASYSHILSKPNVAFKSSDDIVSAILNYNQNAYNINLSSYYHSSVKNDNAGTLSKIPSYTLFDTKGTYHLNEKISLFFQMKNIFDKEYFSPSESSGFTIDVANRGRETFGGLEMSF